MVTQFTQDPQSNLSVILNETGETVMVTCEGVEKSLDTNFFLNTAQGDTNTQRFIDVRTDLSLDKYGVKDYAIFSNVTYQETSIAQKSKGNTLLQPVIALHKDEQFKDTKPMLGSPIPGAIDVSMVYNPTTQTYHLWWYSHCYTTSTSNTGNPDGSALLTGTQSFDETVASQFNVDDFWVIPERNLRINKLKDGNAAKVLFYSTGRKYKLREEGASENPENQYLVFVAPTIVAYYPFGSYTALGGNVVKVPLTTDRLIDTEVMLSDSREDLEHYFSPMETYLRIMSNHESGCARFSGSLDILQDITFDDRACKIEKVMGTLTIFNGTVCDTAEPEGPIAGGFMGFWILQIPAGQ